MEDYIEKLWTTVKGWADKNAQSFVCSYISKDRTDLGDSIDVIKPHRDYFRIWLSQMYLAKEKQWFTEWYPAVHTSVELRFASRTVKVSHVTGPSDQQARGVKLDYAVTDLLPFGGGKVAIESGLIALKGANHLSASIGILQSFSGLVAAPISQALDIAQKVSNGMVSLLEANQGQVRLGFHREFVSAGGGAADLKPGYLAVIAASAEQVPENTLSVRQSQLHSGTPPKPMNQYNYMLFRIEGRSERDDWRFPIVEESINQCIEASQKGKTSDAQDAKTAALTAIWQSPDLAPHDRTRVVAAIEAEIAEATGRGHGAVRGTPRSLNEIMQAHAMPLDEALRQPPLQRAQVVGGN